MKRILTKNWCTDFTFLSPYPKFFERGVGKTLFAKKVFPANTVFKLKITRPILKFCFQIFRSIVKIYDVFIFVNVVTAGF